MVISPMEENIVPSSAYKWSFKLLLVLGSIVILGFESRRDP
jgi:hypothetical protein